MKLKINRIATLTGHKDGVYALGKGKSSYSFFSGGSDMCIVMWDMETKQNEKMLLSLPAIIYSLLFIPEKNILLAGSGLGNIHVLDMEIKKEIGIMKFHAGPVFDLKYNVATDSVFSAGGDGVFAIAVLSTTRLKEQKTLCKEKVRSIALNSSASEIAVASGDCMIRIYDINSLSEKKIFAAHELSANIVCFSPDGKQLLSGGRDAHLKVWSTENYELLKSIPAHNFAIYDIVFSPDNKLFATASRDKTIKLWDANSMELLIRINKENSDGHLNSVNKLLWMENNNYLISTGDDRAVMIWQAEMT